MLCKDSFKRMKIQAMNWEKIFTNNISDKGLAFRIYKELSKFNSKKINNLVFKIGKKLKQIFDQSRSKDGKLAHEKIFNIISHWEM